MQVVELLGRHGGYLSTAQIGALLDRRGPLLAEAMSELVAGQRVRVRYDAAQLKKGAPAVYAAALTRVPEGEAPVRGAAQSAVVRIVRRRRALTYGRLEALVCAELGLRPPQARELIETLYRAWRLHLRVVGDTYVVSAAVACAPSSLARVA